MCIFSGTVQTVDTTRIFVRRTSPARQALVYSMHYKAGSDLAMILPLPKAPDAGEDAVRFIDLSAYPDFFEDMEEGFPKPPVSRAPETFMVALKVHEVGSFEASWVPALADFSRLDPRFRLSPAVWDRLPQYQDYGFAVFQLKQGEKNVHPMALEFETREPYRLFFPTVHVHDGSVESGAEFHHNLYCQSENPGSGWARSTMPARGFLAIDRSMGLLLPDEAVYKRPVMGYHRNEDFWAAG